MAAWLAAAARTTQTATGGNHDAFVAVSTPDHGASTSRVDPQRQPETMAFIRKPVARYAQGGCRVFAETGLLAAKHPVLRMKAFLWVNIGFGLAIFDQWIPDRCADRNVTRELVIRAVPLRL